MADPLGAPPGSTIWEAGSTLGTATPGAAWTRGALVPMVVGPVYFVYGGASVWVLVR
jgi:hypothetical protein